MKPSSGAVDPPEQQHQQQSPEEYHETTMTQSSDPVPAGQLGESVETSPTSLDSVLSIDINTLTTTTASPLSQLVEQIVGPALFPTCEPAVSPQTGFDPGSSESSPVPPDTLDELVDFTTIETAETPLQLTKGVSGSSGEPDLVRQASG